MKHHRVDLGGMQVAYAEVGAGPATLFVHGWPTNGHLWRDTQVKLASTHRTIAIDLPGFGDSDRPNDCNYDFEFYDDVLAQFTDALDLQTFGLVVHDIGGPIGLHWATQNLHRISSLIVMNTFLFSDIHWTVSAFMRGLRTPAVRRLLSGPFAVRNTLRYGVKNQSCMTLDVTKRYVEPCRGPRARAAICSAGGGLHRDGFRRLEQRLPALNVPTLLLHGTDDRILPDVTDTMMRLQEIWPHAHRVDLHGVGHFLQHDAPEQVDAAVAKFYEGLPAD